MAYGNYGVLGANFNDVWSPGTGQSAYNDSPPFQPGQTSDGTGGGTFIYVKFGTGGVASTGQVVTFDTTFTAVLASNTTGALGDKIGVFVGVTAGLANSYGWLQVYGACPAIQVAASTPANTPLATSTTAGQLSNTVTTPTKNLPGILLTTARGGTAGTAPGELNWPVIGTTN